MCTMGKSSWHLRRRKNWGACSPTKRETARTVVGGGTAPAPGTLAQTEITSLKKRWQVGGKLSGGGRRKGNADFELLTKHTFAAVHVPNTKRKRSTVATVWREPFLFLLAGLDYLAFIHCPARLTRPIDNLLYNNNVSRSGQCLEWKESKMCFLLSCYVSSFRRAAIVLQVFYLNLIIIFFFLFYDWFR